MKAEFGLRQSFGAEFKAVFGRSKLARLLIDRIALRNAQIVCQIPAAHFGSFVF